VVEPELDPMKIPPRFDAEFLDWFRERTEAAWADYEPRDFSGDGPGVSDWQPGTRWLNGLPLEDIESAEERFGLSFPPDYRLFLRRLHTVDRPRPGWFFVDGETKAPRDTPSFTDWRDEPAVRAALDGPVSGLIFDLEHNSLWLEGWGPRPEAPAAREAELRRRAASAPHLIPVYSHRCLLGDPQISGNPVLSLYQSDIIFYGPDLRWYLLIEFADLLGLDRGEIDEASTPHYRHRMKDIPFWGELAMWRLRR